MLKRTPNQNTKPSFLTQKGKPQKKQKNLLNNPKLMEMNVLIWLLLFYCLSLKTDLSLFFRLLEHLCKVKAWSWALWKGSVIARNPRVGFNHLLQCLKFPGFFRHGIKTSNAWWSLLMSTLAVTGCFLSWLQLGGTKLIQPEFWWMPKRRKRKEKISTHWMCCPQGCCLLMPWHSACSHWLEIGWMCPFLEGILTFMLCLR